MPALQDEIELIHGLSERDLIRAAWEAANREVYRLLKEGIPVSVLERDSTTGRAELPLRPNVPGGAATPPYQRGGQTTVRVQVIDWEQPANNDFLLVSQFSVTGALYTCRPDLVGFVNGLPLVVIELKNPGVPARAAFDENLTHYKAEIPQLFWFNALLIASNGTDSRVGSLTAERQGPVRNATKGRVGYLPAPEPLAQLSEYF